MYIVELEKGVFIAPWIGDPGRTLKEDNAERFQNEMEANYALTQARMYRPFNNAKIKPVKTN